MFSKRYLDALASFHFKSLVSHTFSQYSQYSQYSQCHVNTVSTVNTVNAVSTVNTVELCLYAKSKMAFVINVIHAAT